MSLIKEVRNQVKALEKERQRKKVEVEDYEDEETIAALDDEEQARQREEKMKRASQVCCSVYSNLRAPFPTHSGR